MICELKVLELRILELKVWVLEVKQSLISLCSTACQFLLWAQSYIVYVYTVVYSCIQLFIVCVWRWLSLCIYIVYSVVYGFLSLYQTHRQLSVSSLVM